MIYLSFLFLGIGVSANAGHSRKCNVYCPLVIEELRCGLNLKDNTYKVFPNKCVFAAYKKCFDADLAETPLKYCMKNEKASRRMYGESCPVFCPNHYRPVCGASKFRTYMYRTFNNGCYLDMLNCRGTDEMTGFIEVPLEYCQRHAMKNIFKEQVVISNLHDYRDYE